MLICPEASSAQLVGWVERSETHHGNCDMRWVSQGLNPSYELRADTHRGIRSRFVGDGAAQQVERHLAVARLAARRTNLLERSLDFTGDAVLYVELEAEETARRDDDGGDQADRYSFHPGDSVCRLRPKCHIVARDGMGV